MLTGNINETIIGEFQLRESGRQAAVTAFERLGYDVGSTGVNGHPCPAAASDSSHPDPSDAALLQRTVEQESIDALPNEEGGVVKIACRLLRIDGWNGAWSSLRREYERVGRFDPELCHHRLKAIVECYSADYAEIMVPDSPG